VYVAVYPDVATTIKNIGVVYDKLGRFEEALLHYRKAQDVFVAVYGDVAHLGLGNVRKARLPF